MVMKSNAVEADVPKNDAELYYDPWSGRWFRASKKDVERLSSFFKTIADTAEKEDK